MKDAIKVTEGGSTTVVLAKLEPEMYKDKVTIPTLNLGDSGFMLLRPNSEKGISKIKRSKEGVWAFDAPDQCGHYCEPPFDDKIR